MIELGANKADQILKREYLARVAAIHDEFMAEMGKRHPDALTRDQKILVFREAGWTLLEIAHELSSSREAVRTRLSRMGG